LPHLAVAGRIAPKRRQILVAKRSMPIYNPTVVAAVGGAANTTEHVQVQYLAGMKEITRASLGQLPEAAPGVFALSAARSTLHTPVFASFYYWRLW
jgi:hypothetical protein